MEQGINDDSHFTAGDVSHGFEGTVMGKIVMLGDSISFRGDWRRLLDAHEVINKGIDGDTTYGVLYRMERIDPATIDVLSLMLGINDIAQGEKAEDICERMATILDHFSGVRRVVTSTLHVSAEIVDAGAMNAEVDALNRCLESVAAARNIPFIDLNVLLSDARGLKPQYTLDGVHLTYAAYTIWSEKLKHVFFECGYI